MANARPKPIAIELDKPRTLVFDFNALSNAELLTGRNFLDEKSWDDIRATDVRALIYAGLLHEDPKITLEKVGEFIHGGNISYVINCISAANRQAAPEPKAGDRPLESAPSTKRKTKST